MERVPNTAERILCVEPREGRETQLLYWFRECVAEWHYGVNPRTGTTHEEILVWDKGRKHYVLEAHWYGKEIRHRCERTALDDDGIRKWIDFRLGEIVWRGDAIEYYPLFVHAVPLTAANDARPGG